MNVQEILTAYISDSRQLQFYLGAEAETVRSLNGRILQSPQTMTGDDSFVQVAFSKQPRLDEDATRANKGVPVYVEREMVTTSIPPNADYAFPRQNHNYVTAKHIFRFPQEYHAFKTGISKGSGTPLTVLSIPVEYVEKLSTYGYNTVERLAAGDATMSSKIPQFNTFKASAEEYLRNKPSTALEKKLSEQDDKIQKLTDALTAATKLLEQQAARGSKKSAE